MNSILFPRSFEWYPGGRSGGLFVPRRVRGMRLCGRRYAWPSAANLQAGSAHVTTNICNDVGSVCVVRASIVVERPNAPHRKIG